MKRLFFLVDAMRLGGLEKALTGLLSSIDFSSTEVHLGVFSNDGCLMPFLPDEVNVHLIAMPPELAELRKDPPSLSIKKLLRKKKYKDAFFVAVLHLLYKVDASCRYYFYSYFLRKVTLLGPSFDEAYAYSGLDEQLVYYVAKKVKARFKVCWIHFDVSKQVFNKPLQKRLLKWYDKVYVVSKQAESIFNREFPEATHKTEVKYNVVPKTQILSLSATGPTFDDDFTGIRILTVARFAIEKGQRDALAVLKQLVDANILVKWYFLGDGPDLDICRKKAALLGLSDAACFLGARLNPYAFMRDCDIYVQPSRNEGFCIALSEALCFDKPIVATDFAGAREQLEGHPFSVIVRDGQVSLFQGIKTLVDELAKQ